MGLGGALIWSAVGRNVRLARSDRMIVMLYACNWSRYFKGSTPADHVVYSGSSDFSLVTGANWRPLIKRFWPGAFIIDQTDPRLSLVLSESASQQTYPSGEHIVRRLCRALSVPCQTLHPVLFLAEDDKRQADRFLAEKGLADRPFFCVEPHAKTSFTPNKAWPFEYWQIVIDQLRSAKPEIAIAQVGVGNARILGGALDLTGKLGFKATAAVVERSLGLATTMGGLVHAAKAMGKRSVVLISGFEPKEYASYPSDINHYHEMPCSNCGLKTACPRGLECMKHIDPYNVALSCLNLIDEP